MKEKTLEQEIPVTKEALLFYRGKIQIELDRQESIVRRLKLVLNMSNEALNKMG